MKTQIIKASLVLLGSLVSVSAFAEDLSKSALQVDFNKMIDEGNQRSQALHHQIDEATQSIESEEQAEVPTRTARKTNERENVQDFLDMEIGIGQQQKAVVDRRFDSIGAPVPVDLTLLPKGS